MTTTAHPKATGGRASARRFVAFVIAIVVSFPTMAPLSATDDGSPQQVVSVRENSGVYSVIARFRVPQPASVVLSVLTDYEQIPRFMPNVDRSVVLERGSGSAVVEQEAISRFMMFSRRVQLVLEIVEAPDALHFRDRSGRSFARYEGTWRVCEEANGTQITYELTAQPSFDVPEFVLKRLLKRDSAEMIQKLRHEIAVRSVQATGG